MIPQASDNDLIKSYNPEFFTEWWEEGTLDPENKDGDLHSRCAMPDGNLWVIYWREHPDEDDADYVEMWATLYAEGKYIFHEEGTKEIVEAKLIERYTQLKLND